MAIDIPRYQPSNPEHASLTEATFAEIYGYLKVLTGDPDSEVLRAIDLEGRTVYGRDTDRVGRRLALPPDSRATLTETTTFMVLNSKGVSLVGKDEDREVPGYPISVASFRKEGEDSVLSGSMDLLDVGVIYVGGEWRLGDGRGYLRPEFRRFTGRIGLDHLLFLPGRPLHRTSVLPDFGYYLREGHGRRVANALGQLIKPVT